MTRDPTQRRGTSGGKSPAQQYESGVEHIARCFDREVGECCGQELSEPSPISQLLLHLLDDVAAIRPTVLDLGCGTAATTLELARRGAQMVTGVDLSPVSIEIARRGAGDAGLNEDRARFEVGDAARTRLQAHDWVVLDRVICCYADPERLIDNASTAAEDRVAFSVPETRGWRGAWNRLGWSVENLWKAIFRRHQCRGYVHDIDAIERFLNDAGLVSLRAERAGLWYAAVFQRVPLGASEPATRDQPEARAP